MQVTDNDALAIPVFKNLPTLDDAASAKEGRQIYRDQEVVEIRLAANKQTVGVFPAHEVCDWVDGPDGSRTPQTYAQKYNAQYLAYKDGAAQTLDGTPLEALAFLSPAKRLELKALNIYTAEALSSLDGQGLKRLGMGGRDLKNQAAAYLETKADLDNAAHLQAVVSEQDKKMAALQAEIDALKAASKPTDTVDHDAVSKKAGAKKPDEKPAEPVVSAFADFEDDDIRNWLKDAGVEVDGRWGRDTLIQKADEKNAELAKANDKAAV